MRTAIFSGVAIVLVSILTLAQTTQPAAPNLDRAAMEIRANEDFNRGQYATALPMLMKLADMSKDKPDALAGIQEKIRVCVANLGSNALNGPRPDATASTASLSTSRTPHPLPKPGEVMEMDIKDLGNFDYDADKGGNIPADVVALTGHRIRLKGYMIPMDQAANITQFALVPSLFSCCFGQPPQIQHTIICDTPKGPPAKAVSYYPDEITIEGTLNVKEKKDDGFIVSIFQIDLASVKPSPK